MSRIKSKKTITAPTTPKTAQVRIDTDMKARLDGYCAATGRTQLWVVSAAVGELIEGDAGYYEKLEREAQ